MRAIQEFVENYQSFVVTSHARPDGDSIGSSLAMALALQQKGKDVRVFHADPAPHAYQWLPGIDLLEHGPSFKGRTEVVVVFECSGLKRTGVRGLESYPVLNIDHHLGCPNYGVANWVDPSAAAVSEMVYKLLRRLKVKITAEIATNLYVGILTDTGSFQFSNTTAETFQITAELAGFGADPGAISEHVYFSQPLSKLRLLNLVLNTLQVHPSGRIATIFMTKRMLSEVGAQESETEGIVTHALSIEGVRAVAFVRQSSAELWRISLRSKGSCNVSELARRFGGGGHINAAGLSLSGSQQSIFGELLPHLEELVGWPSQAV